MSIYLMSFSFSCNLTRDCLFKSVLPLGSTGKFRSEWMVIPFTLNEAFPVVAVTVQLLCRRFSMHL